MKVITIDPHESVNFELASGTIIVLETDEERIDLYTAMVFARVGGIGERLLPMLRTAVLGKKP